jgi:hypothetical protein
VGEYLSPTGGCSPAGKESAWASEEERRYVHVSWIGGSHRTNEILFSRVFRRR